jgi:arylsulfatase A-like enzyme
MIPASTRLLILFCLAALLPAGPARAERPAERKLPSVVLILTDDMGYGDLGCYGCKDIRTPHIDALARAGVRLTDFYSNGPVCTPTRAALMTGRWQQRVGLEWAISPGQKEPGLPARETSLARLLKDAGYRTALCGKWHLGYKKEFAPNAHGFDTFYGLLSGNVDHYSHRENNGELDWYEDTRPVEVKGYSTDLITARAVAFIDRSAGRPFFLYLAYNAVHWPFQAPDRPADVRDKKTWTVGTRKDYAAMLERLDAGVGKVLAALDRHGVAKDTLVIFTNDNGGERLSDNGPFFHHKGTLWEGGIRVPCLLRWPGRLPAGKVSRQPAISMDLTATVLAAGGVRPPGGRKLDGIDLLPLLKGERLQERTFFWRIGRPGRQQRAVRHGDWKLVRDGGIEQLFNLAEDPGERKDRAYRHPEVMRQLRARLAGWEKEMAAEKPMFRVR